MNDNLSKIPYIINTQLDHVLFLTKRFYSLICEQASDKENSRQLHSALVCLSEAYSCINIANTLYVLTYHDNKMPLFEELVLKFKDLNQEFTNSYLDIHMSDSITLKYNEFLKSYDNYSAIFNV